MSTLFFAELICVSGSGTAEIDLTSVSGEPEESITVCIDAGDLMEHLAEAVRRPGEEVRPPWDT